MPARAAYAPLEQARRNLLLQLFWLGLGCALLVWLGTAWVMRPLEALSNAIRTLRRSPDSQVRLDVVANDERGDLAREFDALMAELREQRLEVAAVTDASPVGLFRCGSDGRMSYVNDEYLAIHGLAREEAQEGWLTLVREEIREKVRQDWIRIVSAAEPLNATRRLHRKDGTQVLVALRSRPVLAGGRVMGHVGTVTDITERTRAERALRTLTAVFDMTTDYIVQLDAAGRVIYMNPAARRRTGIAPEAPIERLSVADFNPPQTLERFRSQVVPTAVATGVWVGESMVWDAKREEFPVSHMVIAHRDKHGKVEYFSGLMRDISAAKAAEQALRESEQRLRMVTDHLPALISYLDRDLRFRFVNKAYQDWFGVEPRQLLGRSLHEFYGNEAWAQMEPYIRAALGGRQVTYERRVAGPGGRRDIQATLVPERNEEGEVMGLYTLDSDITAHHEAEEALQESEARLRTVADALPMRVAYIDADERYRFNNLAYEREFGLSRDQIQGHTVQEMLGGPAYESVKPHIRAALAGEAVTFQSEVSQSDSYNCYEAQYIPQPAANADAIVGFHAVITDITRQKLEEKRLVGLAQIDPLTGLANRAGFELRLGEAMDRSRSAGALMALMYLDIDGFKQINDQFGHQTGDELLKAFSGRLSQGLRSSDVRAPGRRRVHGDHGRAAPCRHRGRRRHEARAGHADAVHRRAAAHDQRHREHRPGVLPGRRRKRGRTGEAGGRDALPRQAGRPQQRADGAAADGGRPGVAAAEAGWPGRAWKSLYRPAASTMSFATTSGFDVITTCEASLTTTVFTGLACSAMKACASSSRVTPFLPLGSTRRPGCGWMRAALSAIA
ncbi:PAS domain S-box protein [Variovorax beijingensis]